MSKLYRTELSMLKTVRGIDNGREQLYEIYE